MRRALHLRPEGRGFLRKVRVILAGNGWPNSQSEKLDTLSQMMRLFPHVTAGGSGFLDERRILLGDLIHLHHSLANLLNSRCLFAGSSGNFRHNIADFFHRTDDLAQSLSSLVYQIAAILNFSDAIRN